MNDEELFEVDAQIEDQIDNLDPDEIEEMDLEQTSGGAMPPLGGIGR
jgi:hypothetical protein